MAQDRMPPDRPEDPLEGDSLYELGQVEAELAYLAEWIATHPKLGYRLFPLAETLAEAAERASRSAKKKGFDIPPSEFNVRLSVAGLGREPESYEPRRQAGCRWI